MWACDNVYADRQLCLVLQHSHANELLNGLRYFERKIKGTNGSLSKVSETVAVVICKI
jgi:hypothetical protein